MMSIARAATYLFIVATGPKAARNWLRRNGYTAEKAAKIMTALERMKRVSAKRKARA